MSNTMKTLMLCIVYLILAIPMATQHTFAANLDNPLLDRGEEVYRMTCATSYCHGVGGEAAGAPRLAARDFDPLYIAEITANGVPDTPMAGFANALSGEDLTAVMTYVASLNGIYNPEFSVNDPLASLGIAQVNPRRIPLAGNSQAGRELFFDAYDKGIKRCSTCHEMEGIGIPVAAPIQDIPGSVRALKNLATAEVHTVVISDESMPALILSQGVAGTLLYDLTSVPPVLRTIQPGIDLEIEDMSNWQHRDFIQAYSDQELSLVLDFLNAITE